MIVFWLCCLLIVPASGFFLAHTHTPPSLATKTNSPAVVLSFLVAGISALLSALCYSEFAVCFPISGGAFNYVLATLGEYAAWLTVATLVSARVRGTRGRRARVCLRARACSDRCRRDKKKTLNSKTPPTKHPKNIKILEYVLANAAVARTWPQAARTTSSSTHPRWKAWTT